LRVGHIRTIPLWDLRFDCHFPVPRGRQYKFSRINVLIVDEGQTKCQLET
jgi:hypothetical protein